MLAMRELKEYAVLAHVVCSPVGAALHIISLESAAMQTIMLVLVLHVLVCPTALDLASRDMVSPFATPTGCCK